MRVLFAVLLVAACAGAVSAQKKDVALAAKIAKEGACVGDLFITVAGREYDVQRNGVSVPVVQLTCRVVAATDERRIGFVSWNKDGTARLFDELGNTYVHFPEEKTEGEVWGASVYSDRPAVSFLIFDRPVPKAKTLTLSLSGKNIGQRDGFKLTLKRGKQDGEWELAKPPAKP